MRENYGLYCCWDANNNCFVAYTPDYELCRGMGKDQMEAVAALDAEVQGWIRTGNELGYDRSSSQSFTEEQTVIALPNPVEAQNLLSKRRINKRPEKAERKSLMQKLQKALSDAQKDSYGTTSHLDVSIVFDPCVVTVRGEMTLNAVFNDRDSVLNAVLKDKFIIFDLREVDFIDSSGLALLVEVRKRVGRSDGAVCVVVSEAKNNQVCRVMQMCRFDTIMHMVFSLENALATTAEFQKGGFTLPR